MHDKVSPHLSLRALLLIEISMAVAGFGQRRLQHPFNLSHNVLLLDTQIRPLTNVKITPLQQDVSSATSRHAPEQNFGTYNSVYDSYQYK